MTFAAVCDTIDQEGVDLLFVVLKRRTYDSTQYLIENTSTIFYFGILWLKVSRRRRLIIQIDSASTKADTEPTPKITDQNKESQRPNTTAMYFTQGYRQQHLEQMASSYH